MMRRESFSPPLGPKLFAGEARALGQRLQVGPGDLRMDAATQATLEIRAVVWQNRPRLSEAFLLPKGR
jgi:hypothetical protein